MIDIKNLVKYYGRIPALRGISLKIEDGENLVILGENGAGKTTLLKILYGITRRTSGDIIIDGKKYFEDPKNAIRFGFGYIPQFPPVVDSFYVWEFLKLVRVDQEDFRDFCEEFGFNISLKQRMKYLDLSQKRFLYLAISVLKRRKYYLIDELTSGLPQILRSKLLNVVRSLEGTKILVTHYVDEAIRFADRIIVFRKGEIAGEFEREEFDRKRIIKCMFDKKLPEIEYIKAEGGKTLLKYDGLEVREGEIVGIFGIAGNGQRELFLNIILNYFPSHAGNILRYSVISDMDLCENYIISEISNGVPFWFSNSFLKKLEDKVQGIIKEFNVECEGPHQKICCLSGGNIMKFIVGRALSNDRKLVVLYNPTSGLDEYSKRILLDKIQKMKENGKGILIISEDIEDSVICDKIYVIRNGKLIYISDRENLDIKKIEEAMVASPPARI